MGCEGSLATGHTSTSFDSKELGYCDELFLFLSYAKVWSHLSLQLLALLCSLDDVVRLRQWRGGGGACMMCHLQSAASQLGGIKPLG